MLVHTMPGTSRALLSILILSTVSAFQVTPGSPCTSQCSIDGVAGTNSSDIVCSDTDFTSTSAGLKFQNCVECLQTSRQFSGDNSDLAWFLYNLRYATNVCLFRYPAPDGKNETAACNTDYVCKPLQAALEADQLTTATGTEFGYCTADNAAFRSQDRTTCTGCLQASPNNKYLSNFLIALEAGCEQQPIAGQLLQLSGSLFSPIPVNITASEDPSSHQLSVGAIVGIAVGIAALFIGGAILFVVYYRRQKRYNKEDRARRASYSHYPQYPAYPMYPGEDAEVALEGPSYTLDYKSPVQENESVEEDGGVVDHQEHGGGHKRQASVQASVVSQEYPPEEIHKSPSAMPTHPAYIPRAHIRRNSPATAASSQFTSTLPSREHSVDSQAPIALSAPPPARRPSRARQTDSNSIQASYQSATDSPSSADYNMSSQQQQRGDPSSNSPNLDTDIHPNAVRQLQHHGIYATDQDLHQPNPSPNYNHQLASFSAGPGPVANTTMTRPRASSTSSSKSSPPIQQPVARSRPRGQPPPVTFSAAANNALLRKTHETPLPGRQDIEISGPLAFRDREFRDGGAGAGIGSLPDHRAFRERAFPEGGVGTVGPGAARFAGNGASGGLYSQDRIVQQTFIRKGWVDEVPLDSPEDLW